MVHYIPLCSRRCADTILTDCRTSLTPFRWRALDGVFQPPESEVLFNWGKITTVGRRRALCTLSIWRRMKIWSMQPPSERSLPRWLRMLLWWIGVKWCIIVETEPVVTVGIKLIPQSLLQPLPVPLLEIGTVSNSLHENTVCFPLRMSQCDKVGVPPPIWKILEEVPIFSSWLFGSNHSSVGSLSNTSRDW